MKLTKQKIELEDSPVPTSEKPPRKAVSLLFLCTLVGALIGLAVSVAAGYIVFDSQVTQNRAKQVQDFSRQRSELAAQALDAYFNDLSQQMEIYARQQALVSALEQDDVSYFATVERNLNRQVPNIVAVQVIPAGTAEINAEQKPPLRFAELERIQTIEEGARRSVEAVKVDNQWLLTLMVPISGEGGDVLGVLWLTVDDSGIQSLAREHANNLGELRIFQNFGGRNRILVRKQGLADLSAFAATRLPESHWEVEFQASQGLYMHTHINMGFVFGLLLAVALGCCLIFGTGGWLIGRRLEAAARRKRLEAQMRGKVSSKAKDEYIDPMYQTKNILDVEVSDQDQSLLGLDDDGDTVSESDADLVDELSLDDDVFAMEANSEALEQAYPAEVFRAYDIRGVAGDQINKDFALALGKALGSEVLDLREDTIVVARDARLHSPELTEFLIRGILSTGCNVLNIGTVPTPLMYFTIETMEEVRSGVMVTASHNPGHYNGFKTVIGGVSRSGDDIQSMRSRMIAGKFLQGQGQEHHHDIVPSYIDTIFSDVALAGEMTVVVDAGNGVAGKVAPQLFEELGCRVFPLFCDLDGHFPNHDPDPSKAENLTALIEKVKEARADVGIALDGDGDRLTVVTPSGEIIWADRMLMLFAKDIISRSPGADVVFDVKSTRHLNSCIAGYGGRPIMWKTGHSLMKQKMQETGAVVGAEYSGHIFIKDRWFGFDDGMYAAARLLEVLSLQGEDADMAFSEFPQSISTPEVRIPVAEERKFDIVEKIKTDGDFGEGRLTVIDGVRADFAYGWGLIRASNTSAELTMRFEADDEESLHKLKSLFVQELRKVDSSIEVNWDQ